MHLAAKACFSACALAAVAALPALANSPEEKAIKARHAMMTLYAHNLGILGPMAKGETEYNADLAQEAADDLVALASLYQPPLWPEGTGNAEFPETSFVKAEAWDTYPAIVEKQEAFIEAAESLASAAGGGLEGLQAGMGGLGKSCGSCHEDYRVETD